MVSSFPCTLVLESISLLLLMAMHSCPSSAAPHLPGNETDRMALLHIKLQMNDPNGFLNPWNDSQHHCQWPGVSCNTRHQRVSSLSLEGMALSGTISTHIGNLSFMDVIHLEGNSLHGVIPQQIGQLSRLRSVNLSSNDLSGEIPVNLSRCSKLRYLDLQKNQLTGSIPTEMGLLTKLEFLTVRANNLSGKIPVSLANLSSSLTTLNLISNNLEGHIPKEFGSLSRLLRLGLGLNRLSGEIPPSLFNISTLTVFSVPLNYFLYGKLPANIGLKLQNLQFLAIGGNHFSGHIPTSLTNCTSLQVVDLGENKFVGNFPPGLAQLFNLQSLSLSDNSLSGDVMDYLVPLSNCTNLMELSFNRNDFSGELYSTIGNLSRQLYLLYLSDNKISGTVPMELGNLDKLAILFLANNSLTGVIPKNLAKLQNLEVLHLNGNDFSGKIPLKLCSNKTKLYDFDLSDNNLGGDLSHGLANCQSVQILFISGNKFSGSIPSHVFGSYISPTNLKLSNNSLSGVLPLEIGKLANLQGLDVSQNKLSGHIPSTIVGCLVITLLDMHNNNFSGSLPQSLALLKGIEHLDLSHNNLTGKIPSGFNQLVYLKNLNLSHNDLEGEVPTDGVFANASQVMLEGNSKLCGGISELGLLSCPVVHRNTKGKKHLKIILIPLLCALVISIPLFMYLFLCKKKKNERVGTRMSSVPSEEMLRVSYHDLYRATNEFSPASLIGLGGFGFVYKGNLVLEHGEIKVVAVKVLDLEKRGASKSFKAECKVLSNLRHRNLVPLLTYCSSIDHKGDEIKALVYKYMENGSLDAWLHPHLPLDPSARCLNLLQRLNIAADVASALDHLHNHSHITVAHCDVKPSNILLGNGLTAYVGDFGLARLLPQLQQGTSSSTLVIKGTIGYTAPEYAMGLDVSTQGDVYSYGIMLLEMFTGRRPTDYAFAEDSNLHNYVKKGFSDQVWKIIDPSLLYGEAQQQSIRVQTRLSAQECLISALKLGLGCSQALAKDRMNMKLVTKEMHFIRDAFRVC